jgi:hypothetical protein
MKKVIKQSSIKWEIGNNFSGIPTKKKPFMPQE